MHNEKGWSFFFDENEPAVNFKDELTNLIKRWLIDLIALIPFLISLIILYFQLKISKKKQNKILLGTVPIISFELLSKLLTKHNIDNTLFVFDDWSNGNFHSGTTFKDICTNKFLNKNPYSFGGYIAFFWALKNFKIFALYFDGGFLERTIFWKFEPIIYQIFDKKTILIPYGGDVWSIKNNRNRIQALGHSISRKRYFLLDKKREDRIYHWSKYVNIILAYINYIDYLPKIDILVYHGHIVEDIDLYDYNFIEDNPIKIIHYANDEFRKGSLYIETNVNKLDIESEFYYAKDREFLLSRLDASHFYIEQITDGFFSYSAIEAMLKGKIVFLYLDENISNIYKIINSKYYIDFFNNSPLVNINANNLEEKLVEYTKKEFHELKSISKQTHEFAKKLLKENEKMYINIFEDLIK